MSEKVLTTHNITVNLRRYSDQWHIIPLSDQHSEAKAHDAAGYRAFLDAALKLPNPHFLFCGDEMDFASTTERAAIKQAKLHGTTRKGLDYLVLDRCKAFVKQHERCRGRILGMIEGNHTWSWQCTDGDQGIIEGQTSTQWIARQLGAKWLGWLGYVRASVRVDQNGKNQGGNYSVDVVACHGKAGGKLVGTTINQVDDLRRIFPLADIYIMGHDHKRGAWPSSSLYMPSTDRNPCLRVKEMRQWLVRAGSWLKTYEPDTPNYCIGSLLKPSELGGVVISCKVGRLGSRVAGREIVKDIKVTA